MNENIKFKAKVKDTITGFTGMVTARCEYLNGCIQYRVSPTIDKDGKMQEDYWIDSEQLEVIKEPKEPKVKKEKITGGPDRNPPTGKM